MCIGQVQRANLQERLFPVTSAILHKICLILMDYSVFVVETDCTTPELLPEETVLRDKGLAFFPEKKKYSCFPWLILFSVCQNHCKLLRSETGDGLAIVNSAAYQCGFLVVLRG